jgi:hypothetical protein
MRERGIQVPTRQLTLSVPPDVLRATVEREGPKKA